MINNTREIIFRYHFQRADVMERTLDTAALFSSWKSDAIFTGREPLVGNWQFSHSKYYLKPFFLNYFILYLECISKVFDILEKMF